MLEKPFGNLVGPQQHVKGTLRQFSVGCLFGPSQIAIKYRRRNSLSQSIFNGTHPAVVIAAPTIRHEAFILVDIN